MAKKVKKKTKKAAVKKAVKKKTAKKKAVKKAVKKKTAKKAAKKKKAKKAVKKAAPKKKAVSKKKSTPKKSTRKKVSRKRKSRLSASDMAYFRELLIEKLKEITGDVNHIETEALKSSRQDSAGDLSSMPIHMADVGSDNYEQEFALGLMDSERKIVREIYEALRRIQEGTYGICEGTGEPIPKMRLEGIPWTRYCVQFAEMLEKGLVDEPEQAFEEPEPDEDDELDDMYDEDDPDDSKMFFYSYDDDDDDDDEEVIR